MCSRCKTLIILMGPQGVGKTTLARTLHQRYAFLQRCRTAMIAADSANSIHTAYLRIISNLRGLHIKFYLDRPGVLCPDPQVLSKLWVIEFLIGIFGHILALLKLALLLLSHDVIIEHEGYTFKFVANFAYIQYMYANIIAKSRSTRRITRALTLILTTAIQSLIRLSKLMKLRIYVINVQSTYNKLISRYRLRDSPVEPRHYIEFQLSIFNIIEELLRSLTRTINVAKVCT